MICEKCGEEKVKFGAYTCKVCRDTYHALWRKENRDQVNTGSRQWAAKNKDKRKETQRKYDKANPDKAIEKQNRRRARVKQNGVVKYSYYAMMERDNYTCVYCGDKAEHLDHIVSIYRGGQDSPDNVTAACAFCNFSKNRKTATEFMLPMFKKVVKQLEVF